MAFCSEAHIAHEVMGTAILHPAGADRNHNTPPPPQNELLGNAGAKRPNPSFVHCSDGRKWQQKGTVNFAQSRHGHERDADCLSLKAVKERTKNMH